jgi:hypothetical protein
MTHSDAARIAAEKFPIYLEDDPEKGIKKTCPLEKMKMEWHRDQLIKKLMQQSNGESKTL